MSRTITADIADILRKSEIEGQVLRLPAQLDRATYDRANKVLGALGGKWRRSVRGHQFPFDPRELLADAVSTGKYSDRKKDLQFFPTPAALAREMVARARLRAGDTVLEPSAGHGAIVAAMPADLRSVYAVELDDQNAFTLRANTGHLWHVNVVQADFLAIADTLPANFDALVMNPPFAKRQDIAHVQRAWTLLRPGGRLVAIVSSGAVHGSTGSVVGFKAWLVEIGASVEMLPQESFRESGTSANTAMISAARP